VKKASAAEGAEQFGLGAVFGKGIGIVDSQDWLERDVTIHGPGQAGPGQARPGPSFVRPALVKPASTLPL